MAAQNIFKDPVDFAHTFLRIIDKEQTMVRLDYKAVQRDWLAHRTRRDLILKFRQPGVSTAIQADFSRLAWTRTVSTATLSHQNSTTQRFRRMVDRFYDNLPADVRPTRHYNNAVVSTYPDFDSEAIIATAGSEDVGRGFTSSHFHGSEAAYWRNADELIAGILQSVPLSGRIVMESTANGAQGWFYERCMEALDGDETWKLHFYPWWFDPDDPDYQIPLLEGEVIEYEEDEQRLVDLHGLTAAQIKFRRAKQKELLWRFPQEYPEDPRSCFLTSGEAFFGIIDDDVWTASPPEIPEFHHRIVGGVDFGQKNDFTVLVLFDVETRQQVALLRINKLPWEEMRARIRQLAKQWGASLLMVELNSMGSTNFEEMVKEFDADDGLNCDLYGLDTTPSNKPDLMNNLYVAIHEDGWKLLDDDVMRQEFRVFKSEQLPSGRWRYEAPSGSHDDTVMATAFAIHAARTPMAQWA